MCGIAGILSDDGRPVDRADLAGMCAALVHRGPDDEGFYQSGPVGLAMRRLSIIDLETGSQPVRNEDGTVWAVFNGEIYNYRDLRRDLRARGHAFYTDTDTETIVHLYEEYGERCVEHLRGMFALAVWDESRQTLLLARDRVGIKPLFYGRVGGRLVFASELKAILQLSEVDRRLNWKAVSHVFAFLSTPRSESAIEGIRKLEPGHTLTVSPGRGMKLSRYWDVQYAPDHGRTEAQSVERLREMLEESVRLHLASDVPLGAFLSGGVDSSAVVATMTRLGDAPVKTFSIGFRDADFDELSYARLAARTLGTDHHERVLEPDLAEMLEDLTWCLDEPFGDPSAIPTYAVSQLASEHVKVVLSGDGGDELFAGYDKYRVEQRERVYERLVGRGRGLLGAAARLFPEGVRGRNRLRHMSLAGDRRYLDATTFFSWEEQQKLFQPEALALFTGADPWRQAMAHLARKDGHWLSRLQYLDLQSYLPLDILPKVDRMSMAHSIEARVPLLDHKLIEFAATIPPELNLREGSAKYLLKQAMKGVLPDEILYRPKHGFAVPLGRWLRGRLGDVVRELLLSERTRQRGIFDTRYIERLLRRHERGRELDFHIWTLVSFELWCRMFLDGSPGPTVRPRPVPAASHLRPPRPPAGQPRVEAHLHG